jgi:hypothetical protein
MKAKIIANNSHHCFFLGDIIEVIQMSKSVFYCNAEKGYRWFIQKEDIEIIKED